MRRLIPVAVAALVPVAAAHAAALIVTKSSSVVADSVNTLNPKAIPAATIDYAIRVDNPNGVLSGTAIAGVTIQDTIPDSVTFRVTAYGAGTSPVEFADGSLLGLLGSGLGYTFSGLASTGDGLEFFNGTTWTYTPVADAQGYDANVRGIRVKLTGTQVAGSSFRLRFRVRVK